VDLRGLYYTARALRALVDDAVRQGDGAFLPAYQQSVLRAAIEHPGLTVTELARQASVAQSLTSRYLPAAESAGLLRVERDAADRRRVRVHPGPKLRSRIEPRLDAGAEEILADYLPELSERGRKEVLQGLAALHRAFKEADGRKAAGAG
jgi:DNA-binding MarR family transcriptional regulator